VQYLNDAPIGAVEERRLRGLLDGELEGADLLMVADFGHGLMSPGLRERVSGSGAFMALNTQSNSANLGFNPVTKYARADFVSIDEPELKLAAGTQYGNLHELGERVRQRLQSGCFLVSRGGRGSFIMSEGAPITETPALAAKVVDRTGAGDALFSITAPCVRQGYPMDVVGFLGNCVGALAVETVCNREPVDPVLLYKFITSLLK
jgi:sugar/nucleoside kinase (ribokinase family)